MNDAPANHAPKGEPKFRLDAVAAAKLARSIEHSFTPTPSVSTDAGVATATTPDAPGEMPSIPGYTLLEPLGRGGSADVYRAVRTGSDTHVAIKLFRMPTDGHAAKRAWSELHALDALRIPCVPRLLDHGEIANGRRYIVTEFIDGAPIDAAAAALPKTKRGVRARVELLARAAEAVHLLHERGIIHRDLKPGNILVAVREPGTQRAERVRTPSPREGAGGGLSVNTTLKSSHESPATRKEGPDTSAGVYIVDLGLARVGLRDAADTILEPGQVLGTPAFMPPEQARGERAAITTRSDVFALGAIAMKVLTGGGPWPERRDAASEYAAEIARATSAPIDGRAPAPATDSTANLLHTLAAAVSRPPTDPHAHAPTLDKGLAAILRRACAALPADRYTSAKALALDLRAWLHGEPLEAQPPGVLRRIGRWMWRHKAAAVLILSILTGVTIIASSLSINRWLLTVPAALVVDAEHTTARLTSRAGTVIATFGSGEHKAVSDAKFVRRPDRLGGGHVVWGAWNEVLGGARTVHLIDPHNHSINLWKSSGPAEFPPAFAEKVEPQPMLVQTAAVGDMLPDPSGEEGTPEIAVIYRHPNFFPCCLRVYDLAGTVRYELWNRGWIYNLHWQPTTRRLYALGVENGVTVPIKPGENTSLHAYNILALNFDTLPTVRGKSGSPAAVTPLLIRRTPPPLDGSLTADAAGSINTRIALTTPTPVTITAAMEPIADDPDRSPRPRGDTAVVWHRWILPWSENLTGPKFFFRVPTEPKFAAEHVRLLIQSRDGTLSPKLPDGKTSEDWITIDKDGRVVDGDRNYGEGR